MEITVKIHELEDGKLYGVVKHQMPGQLGQRTESTKLHTKPADLKEEVTDKFKQILEPFKNSSYKEFNSAEVTYLINSLKSSSSYNFNETTLDKVQQLLEQDIQQPVNS